MNLKIFRRETTFSVLHMSQLSCAHFQGLFFPPFAMGCRKGWRNKYVTYRLQRLANCILQLPADSPASVIPTIDNDVIYHCAQNRSYKTLLLSASGSSHGSNIPYSDSFRDISIRNRGRFEVTGRQWRHTLAGWVTLNTPHWCNRVCCMCFRPWPFNLFFPAIRTDFSPFFGGGGGGFCWCWVFIVTGPAARSSF